jgi:S1-C subfamily serine protease
MTRFWRYFASNGKGSRRCSRLGIRGYSVPLLRSLASQLHLTQAAGVEVWRVVPNSPADEAGIQVGDILVTLADEPVPNLARLRKILRHMPVGFPVEIVLLRDEGRVQCWAVPDAAHAN